MDVFVFLMLNNLIDDAEHCEFEGYHKTPFLFKGHNLAKNLTTIKLLKGNNSEKISKM